MQIEIGVTLLVSTRPIVCHWTSLLVTSAEKRLGRLDVCHIQPEIVLLPFRPTPAFAALSKIDLPITHNQYSDLIIPAMRATGLLSNK